MISKNELYKKIMENVAQIVKKTLDETFTTYPWDKVQNYINEIQAKYNICIKQDILNFPAPDKQLLSISNFDDERYIVFSLTHDIITADIEYFNNIKKALQLVGIKYSKSYIDGNKEYLQFLPNKQNIFSYDALKNSAYFYHICPHYATEKIKKFGFQPKSKNSIFEYDPRIHFCFVNTPENELRLLKQQLDDNNKSKGNDHNYDLITIRIPEHVHFYKDLDCAYGICTNENISPEYIEKIESINGISIDEYTKWKIKMMFSL